jgi:nucleotide-binding universal stress UspA family protein
MAELASHEAREGAGFHRLLVCLDRSALAENVLPLTAHLAELDHAPVTLMHVLECVSDEPSHTPGSTLQWEIVRQEANAYLEHAAESLRQGGLSVESQVTEGSPALGVADVSQKRGADLLVLSTRGEHAMQSSDMGSLGGTAGKILASARGAVLVFPSGRPLTHVPLARVLVPLDGSLRSETVLPTALRLARADHAELVIAHVVPDPIRTEVLSTPEDLDLAQRLADHLARRAEEYLERTRRQLSAGGATVKAVVTRATDHREGLIALAAAEQIDLIVVSAHGSVCNPRRRFGSVTTHLLAHASAPVLVLQDLTRTSATEPVPESSRLPSRSLDATPGVTL